MSFRFEKLEIPGLILVEATAFPDDRGFFAEMYKHSDFVANGIPEHFVQDNLAHSTKGTRALSTRSMSSETEASTISRNTSRLFLKWR